jgi:hypothetical protein
MTILIADTKQRVRFESKKQYQWLIKTTQLIDYQIIALINKK